MTYYFAARRHLLDVDAFHAKGEEKENIECLVADLPKRPKRVELEQVCKENMSSWFTVGPSKQYGLALGLALTVQGDFPDRLNLRHGWAGAAGAALGV